MTVEMRMKDGRKYTGEYAKVHDTMVALHGQREKPPGMTDTDFELVPPEGRLVALVPVVDVLEVVRVEATPA